eukprot:2597314-Karenia_brevis.AAC.1
MPATIKGRILVWPFSHDTSAMNHPHAAQSSRAPPSQNASRLPDKGSFKCFCSLQLLLLSIVTLQT